MPQRVHLLTIDAQNDFCDLPEAWCPVDPLTHQRLRPALPVPGAHADLLRLARFIDDAGDRLSDITTTLDSHHLLDIAHPPFWQRSGGAAVVPFTTITAEAVRAGDFAPRDPALLARSLAYLDALQARGRYTLMVWPVHCQIGSWGQGLHPAVLAACNAWEARRLRPVQAVHKGEHLLTEHYSALEAEVPDAEVPATALNQALLARLDQADQVLVAGQAASHCVKATAEHLLDHLPQAARRLVLLTDCMSPVAGFEAAAQAFLAGLQDRGVRCCPAAQAWPAP